MFRYPQTITSTRANFVTERVRPDHAQARCGGEGKAGRDEEEACVQHAQVEYLQQAGYIRHGVLEGALLLLNAPKGCIVRRTGIPRCGYCCTLVYQSKLLRLDQHHLAFFYYVPVILMLLSLPNLVSGLKKAEAGSYDSFRSFTEILPLYCCEP